MNAVLSHSVRWCKAEPQVGPLLESYEGGALFYQRAVTGLFDSLRTGYAGIPTIQTLLLLSAQECGRGNRTQAWLYSGMAFRLLDDLGISIDSRKYPGSAHLSDEDVEIRNRLFWSCYFWDKIISLYFGRAPTMQHSRVSPPRMIRMFTSTFGDLYILTTIQSMTLPRLRSGRRTASPSLMARTIRPHRHTQPLASFRCADLPRS